MVQLGRFHVQFAVQDDHHLSPATGPVHQCSALYLDKYIICVKIS